ncbi:MAG: chromate efflux transporter [Phycisphaerales bacterium]|nr:MAG: chromate efflux transporter [Phycisphaerales bacterium]
MKPAVPERKSEAPRSENDARDSSGHQVPMREAVWTWVLVGLQSFGGPAGQIAVMHRILVQEKHWISESRFLHALNYCMLLPGPEAMQLATYVGWLMHRTLGGLIAGILFVLPGFVSILALSVLYAGFREMTVVDGLFFGLKPAVLAVVVQAVIKIGGRALKNRAMYVIAAGSFIAMFFFNVPFPLIIASAAIIGLLGHQWRPETFLVIKPKNGNNASDDDSLLGEYLGEHTQPTLARSVRTAVVWLALWFLPVVALLIALGPQSVYVKEAAFFSTAAVVTFGGAYAVLAFVAQQAVEVYGWLQPGEMLDGLGMAETTPGPLIQVVQFVGFMGAYRDPGEINPFIAGTLASVLVTWVTFVPCFLWIFLGGPYIESLRQNQKLSAALSAITAAVVGVVLNLAIWFAIHTLFSEVVDFQRYGLRVPMPTLASIDLAATAIGFAAAVMLFVLKKGMIPTLLICAAIGVVYRLMMNI